MYQESRNGQELLRVGILWYLKHCSMLRGTKKGSIFQYLEAGPHTYNEAKKGTMLTQH